MFMTIFGVLLALIISLALIYKWKANNTDWQVFQKETFLPKQVAQLMHRLCPHHNVVQSLEVEKKDSLDEHLDILTRKLAEKEIRLRVSKSRIMETQNEIDNLHAMDSDVRQKYRDVVDALRSDLISNEEECRRLQEQIEWVSRKRAELNEEIKLGQQIYGQGMIELATNLTELHKGKSSIVEKAHNAAYSSPRVKKEPNLPKVTPCSMIIKPSQKYSNNSLKMEKTE